MVLQTYNTRCRMSYCTYITTSRMILFAYPSYYDTAMVLRVIPSTRIIITCIPSQYYVQEILTRLTSRDHARKSIQFWFDPKPCQYHRQWPCRCRGETCGLRTLHWSPPSSLRVISVRQSRFSCILGGKMGGKHSRASSQSLSQPSNLGSELTENRQKEVILCRLRHTYATHGHILRGEERPLCLRCYVPLAVAHVFFFCLVRILEK